MFLESVPRAQSHPLWRKETLIQGDLPVVEELQSHYLNYCVLKVE